MSADLSYEKNGRGFKVYPRMKDRDGNEVKVQESSLATEPAIRIFSEGPTSKEGHIHLTIHQACSLVQLILEACKNHHQFGEIS